MKDLDHKVGIDYLSEVRNMRTITKMVLLVAHHYYGDMALFVYLMVTRWV